MNAPAKLPACCRYVCPKCGAPRGFRCNYVTPLGFVQIDREVRSHPSRVARWRRLARGPEVTAPAKWPLVRAARLRQEETNG